jgi:hypothetical protein
MTEVKYVNCTVRIKSPQETHYLDDYKREADGVLFNDELFRMTLTRLADWVAQNERSSRGDLELLGRYLYRLIFNDLVGKAFETSYEYFEEVRDEAKADDRVTRLRLRLVFEPEAEELAAYPWEFIFMPRPKNGFFLSGEKIELILTRFVGAAEEDLGLSPDEEPLKILVASANPSERAFDIGDLREMLEGSIGKLKNVRLRWKEQPRYKDLTREIEEFKPHIFHFIGHGEAGKLALIRPDDEIVAEAANTGTQIDSHWIDSDTFSEMFAEYKPRLIFLHACKGAATFKTTLNAFTSMARELAYSDIPAVVGMQYEIADTDATTFASVCYRELAAGRAIDEAVTAGRRELGRFSPQAWGDRRFGTPLVYLQASLPIIFSAGTSVDDEQSADARDGMATESYPCPGGTGCPGLIIAGKSFCPKCGVQVMMCPNGHMMARGMHCPDCEFDDRDAVAVSAAPAQPAGSESSFG